MKKKLFIAAALIFTGTAVFADAAAGQKNYAGGKPWMDSEIKENIENVQRPSPKEDFNLYVNYDWLQKKSIPAGKMRYDSFIEVSEHIQKNILEVLKNTNIPGTDAENVQTLYHAILDWNSRNALGMKPVESVVEEIKKITTLDELSDFITNPDKTFLIPTFIIVSNQIRFDDSSSYIAEINNDGFLLGDAAEYKKRTEIGERFYKGKLYEIKALLSRIGYTEEEAEKMFNDALNFESLLSKRAYTNKESMSPDFVKKINNILSPDKLYSLSPKFPLKKFITNYGYGEAKEFLITSPKCISDLNKLYKKENLESMKTYMTVKTVLHYAPCLDNEAYNIAVNAGNIINGSTGKISDEEMAVEAVQSLLATPLNRAYLKHFDLSDLKKRITEICKSVIEIYREMLKNEDWLSEQTKQKAIEKLDNIKINSIYPEKWIDYSALKLKGLSYIDCLKAIDNFESALNRTYTNGKVDKEIWLNQDLLITNAFYNPQENSINIIPGLLENPFYYEGMSQEALLGGIGSVIGHEISHAFDTNGAQFDKDGSMNNWWTKNDFTAFQKRADKLISYFDTITVYEGLQVNGTGIQTEAIADMAGVKTMLIIAKSIPGFNYKEFFESYGTVWRRLMTPETVQYYTANNVHPNHFLRSNVNVQQFDEFYETYDIKPGDNMYLAPEDRILVW